jgi:hypothetical protein
MVSSDGTVELNNRRSLTLGMTKTSAESRCNNGNDSGLQFMNESISSAVDAV